MKRILEALGWLTAVALFAFAGHAVFGATASAHALADAQDNKPRARQDAPSSDEQRGGGNVRKAGPRENLSPVSIMRGARTIYVRPTQHLDKKYLEYKLQKYRELQDWGLMLVTEERAADLVITFEKTALNYIFTINDPRTSVIVTSGKTVAVNGLVAAENLGREIIKKIRDVRASSDPASRRKRPRAGDDDNEEDTP
ncbi:MAG: hypothetical protein H0T60_06165 [Acidobacteria bacterium]|nr:hypothetical protein [Acidobacteriota bacterium]